MSKFYNLPTPAQRELDAAMARAQERKASKSFIQWLSNLFNAARRERRTARTLAGTDDSPLSGPIPGGATEANNGTHQTPG